MQIISSNHGSISTADKALAFISLLILVVAVALPAARHLMSPLKGKMDEAVVMLHHSGLENTPRNALLIQMEKALVRRPDVFDYTAHGRPGITCVPYFGAEFPVGPDDLADFIKRNTDYIPGQKIRLLVCEAGSGGANSTAQKLADALKVDVEACTGKVQLRYTDGAQTIAEPFPVNGVWLPFRPSSPP
jgi:hypothetical protein